MNKSKKITKVRKDMRLSAECMENIAVVRGLTGINADTAIIELSCRLAAVFLAEGVESGLAVFKEEKKESG